MIAQFRFFIRLLLLSMIGFAFLSCEDSRFNIISKISNKKKSVGQKVDSLNGVYVYYNGATSTVVGRNTTSDGYNLGLEYQCVEFVKRYYYEHLDHKMPNSYGHAKDFFDKNLADGQYNADRNLKQYSNPSERKPKVNDLVVFDKNIFNSFGHIGLVSKVEENKLEIIQQNKSSSRVEYGLENSAGKWRIKNSRILGWLGKE